MASIRKFLHQRGRHRNGDPKPEIEQRSSTWIRATSALSDENSSRGISKTDQTRLCEKCSKIIWEDLLDPSRSATVKFPIYDLPPEKLKDVSCQVCQFVGEALLVMAEQTKSCAPPYQLERQPEKEAAGRNISLLRFKELAGYWTQPLRGANAFLVLRNQEAQRDGSPGNLMVGGLPVDLIKRSIATCQSHHEDFCQPNDGGKLRNLKVFDCEERMVVPAPAQCAYVALSYVWGSYKKDTSVERATDADSIPKTVEDSVRITQGLGYRYLWVDRYCIDQSSHGDKLHQISQMSEIYACAQLTIIAAAGDDSYHGLCRITTISDASHSLSLEAVTLLRYPLPLANDTLSNTTWASRAWTFQECYFSKRRLFVLPDRSIFVCNSEATRHMPRGWYTLPDSAWPDEHEKLRAMRIIEAYCGREMTYESDALLAIVSALNTFDQRTTRHVWGLPFSTRARQLSTPGVRSKFIPGLLWAHEKPCSRRGALPSWSPMAWTGKIVWCDQPFVYTWAYRLFRTVDYSMPTSDRTANNSNDPEVEPRLIRITARVSKIRLVTTSRSVGYENAVGTPAAHNRQEVFLAIKLSKDIELISHAPCWDVDPSSIELKAPILGVLFDDDDAHESVKRSCILLVQWTNGFYERVGVLPLTYPSYNIYCHFTHESKYIRWLSNGAGGIRHLEVCTADDYVDHDHPVYNMYKRATWKHFFKQQEILLG